MALIFTTQRISISCRTAVLYTVVVLINLDSQLHSRGRPNGLTLILKPEHF